LSSRATTRQKYRVDGDKWLAGQQMWGQMWSNVGSDLHNSLMFKDNITKELTIFLLKARFAPRNSGAIPTGGGIQEGLSTPLPKHRA